MAVAERSSREAWQWGVVKAAAAGGHGGVAQPTIRQLDRVR